MRIAFIGCGNMGGAILRGVLKNGCVKADDIFVCDHHPERLEGLGVKLCGAGEAASAADVVILAVKPQMLADVIADIKESLNGKAVISIAAGWTNAMLQAALEGTEARVLRVMPNTPAMVGEGLTALCAENTLTDEEFAFAEHMFAAAGKTVTVAEKLFDAVIGVSGSGPAYVYMMIEAMADAGVREGLKRPAAYTMAAQTMLGAAKMVLETGEHPAALKDAVCSPAGTTIDAVAALEAGGFRSAVIEAVHVCAEKSRAMAKKS